MKTLTFILCLLVVATAASAASVTANCTPFPSSTIANGIGSSSVSCPDAFTAGVPSSFSTLLSATLNEQADYLFGNTVGTNSITMSYTPSVQPWTPTTSTSSTSGTTSSGSVGTTSQNWNGSLALNFASFTVTLTSSVTSGTVAASTGAVSVSYNYTYNPPSTTPEPTAMCLIGLGMLGLGIPALRRKIR